MNYGDKNQNNLLFDKLTKLQNKALKFISFQPPNTPTGPLQNALFVRNTPRKENLPLFNEMFNTTNQNGTFNTRPETYNLLDIPQVRKSHFGEFSIRFKASETWNEFQRNLNNYGPFKL